MSTSIWVAYTQINYKAMALMDVKKGTQNLFKSWYTKGTWL